MPLEKRRMSYLVMAKPHLVLIPFPAQGHLTALLNLAKLLHSKGFYITFVVTDFTYRSLIRSRGPGSVSGLPGFSFQTIPDGLSSSDDANVITQDIPSLCSSIQNNFLAVFKNLLVKKRLDDDHSTAVPPVTCIVSDGTMSFTIDAAEELKIPVLLFHTISACGFLGYLNYPELQQKGYTPLKDESCLANGYLDTPIDWIPGMNNIRLRDLPSFLRTTDPNDVMLNMMIKRKWYASRAKSLILNTFEELDQAVLSGIRTSLPNNNLYTIGPLSPTCHQIPSNERYSSIGSNLLREDSRCLDWLDKKTDRSVMYVNFGSITVVTEKQLEEFAWGLANSGHPFLWVIRPDLVSGEEAKLQYEFVKETEGRGVSMLAPWCDQEAVLAHRSVGGFLTHCGWNSTLESIYEGVPMICWPFFAEQPTNCRFVCTHWGVGKDMDGEVRRERVEELVREMMEKEKGKEMRKKAMEWKEKARRAIEPGGSSYANLERLVEDLANMKRL